MSLALLRAGMRMVAGVAPGPLARFVGAGVKSARAVHAFERERRRGRRGFPAFLFLSVTQRCQYACRGCWARGAEPALDMAPELLRDLIRQSSALGRKFIGILGGEPLLVPGLPELLGEFRDCYFLLFTNGAALDGPMARRLRKAGNISPLVSLEGDVAESDVRRGALGVHARTVAALASCREARLPFGVATSLCRDNLESLANDTFVRTVIRTGAQYLWYYLYRPVGPEPDPVRCLTGEQILRVRRFLVDARTRHPIVLVDAYWDADGRALCPAATGISHHINAMGDVEPCPPIQVAAERVSVGDDLRRTVEDSAFLAAFRDFAAGTTRGCVLLERPAELAAFVEGQGPEVRDSSGRGTVRAELASMRPVPGHDVPGREIPEKGWAYRFAKRRWFFGFGAYG